MIPIFFWTYKRLSTLSVIKNIITLKFCVRARALTGSYAYLKFSHHNLPSRHRQISFPCLRYIPSQSTPTINESSPNLTVQAQVRECWQYRGPVCYTLVRGFHHHPMTNSDPQFGSENKVTPDLLGRVISMALDEIHLNYQKGIWVRENNVTALITLCATVDR